MVLPDVFNEQLQQSKAHWSISMQTANRPPNVDRVEDALRTSRQVLATANSSAAAKAAAQFAAAILLLEFGGKRGMAHLDLGFGQAHASADALAIAKWLKARRVPDEVGRAAVQPSLWLEAVPRVLPLPYFSNGPHEPQLQAPTLLQNIPAQPSTLHKNVGTRLWQAAL